MVRILSGRVMPAWRDPRASGGGFLAPAPVVGSTRGSVAQGEGTGLVALDIDNTLAATNCALWRRFPASDRDRCHGAPVSPEWFASAEGRQLLAEVHPLRGATRGASTLAKRGGVVYVTTRPVAASRETWTWLRAHRFPSGPVVFVGSSDHKARWAQLLGVGLAVDDDPAAARAYRAARIPCLLPRWRYNAADPQAGSWDRLLQLLPGVGVAAEAGTPATGAPDSFLTACGRGGARNA